jgi:hypothetical protein
MQPGARPSPSHGGPLVAQIAQVGAALSADNPGGDREATWHGGI